MTTRRNRVLLTVDWDAFIPVGTKGDPQLWDIGHAETNLHINTLWALRGKLESLMQVDQKLAGPFWMAMNARFPRMPQHTLVSDSHMYVFPWLQDITTVVLVDAHHDCWEGPKDKVDCANWARVWLGKSRTKRIHWIIPDWVDASVYEEWNFVKKDKRVWLYKLSDVILGNNIVSLPDRIDRVHVCRSGCWTPPWLDQVFIDWLRTNNRECYTVPKETENTDWDALRCRWGAKEYAAMRENLRASDEAMARYRVDKEAQP